MKKHLALPAALFVLALGCHAPGLINSQDQKPRGQVTPGGEEDRGAAMKGLRDKLLASTPEEVGLEGEDAEAKVWGVLMEFGFPEGTATLVSVRDGTASLYTTAGGGILGGYTAREEARACVAEAEKRLAQMKPTKSFPYPGAGRVRFYLLTRGGVYTAEAGAEELARGRHDLSPLFRAGDGVLTKLREAHERAQPGLRP